jgi:signal transduction histidine kinase
MDNQFIAIFVIGIIILVVLVNVFIFWFVLSIKKREFESKMNIEKINANYERQMFNLKNETRNTEMKYFARELHDNLGQITSQLKRFLDFNIEQKKIIETNSGSELINQLKIEIRRLSTRYNHFVFDEINLVDSISNDILRISKFSNMMIDLNIPEDDIIAENNIKAEVFRIYQELINNTMNHSKAKNMKISMNSNALASMELIIEDDGIGFDPTLMKKGSGLYNVTERAKQIGGTIIFQSNPGSGTLTTLTIINALNA